MGNDGGSIPKRRELVKEAARNPTAAELKETLQEQQAHLWNVDPLSSQPLSKPIVSDSLGRLFNKDSVISFLLTEDKSTPQYLEQEALLKGTVKSLKDVVEVKFEVDEAATEAIKSHGRSPNMKTEVYVCPITREELGPKTKAVYLVPCGHAFSASAVKEVSGEQCLQCNESYASNDIIPILPTVETDIARLTLRIKILKEKGLAHSLKKTAGSSKKKRKNDADDTTTAEIETSTAEVPASDPVTATIARISNLKETTNEKSPIPSKPSTPLQRSGTSTPKVAAAATINNAATASLTAKVLQEQEQRNKRRKMEENKNINTLYATSKKGQRDIDFMNRGFSMPGR